MKHILDIIALALVLAILVPTIADACPGHKCKPTTCTSYTNITGTTRTTCR
jgi:hypothetical protein